MTESAQGDGEATFEHLRLPEDQSPRATISRRDYESAPTLASQPPAPISDEWRPTVWTSSSARARAELPLRRILGAGGVGCVFLAEQTSLGREVAVKLLRPELASAEHAQSLLAEARTAGALEHPNVVPVHLIATDEQERPALVMKRVEGVAWSALIYDADHPFWEKVPASADRLEAHLGILIQVCNALQFAHSRRILHRDIKPDNVMVGAFGEVYVMDWGLATSMDAPAEARTGRWRGPVGTPCYMAPELALGRPADERTDVFLLGAVLHEVLTRTPRHAGATVLQMLYNAASPKPVVYDEQVPDDLAALANRATASARNERVASVAEFRAALIDHLSHRGSARLTRAAVAIYQQLASGSLDAGQSSEEQSGARVLDARGSGAARRAGQSSEEQSGARVLDARASGAARRAGQFERLASECRFAFTQALSEWPENRDARRGLHDLLALLLRRALERGDLETASALLASLPDRDESLEAAVRDAEQDARSREHAGARAQRIASEMDLSVGARGRKWFFGTLAGAAVVWNAAFFVALHFGWAQFTHRSILTVAVVLVVCVTGLTVVARRALFRNSINRRVALLPVLGVSALFVHRLAGVLRDIEVASIVADDLLMLGILSLAAALFVRRAYLMTSAAFFSGALLSMIHPAWTQPFFTVFAALGLLSVFLLWLRSPDDGAPARDR